jgi:phosphoribosylaminoimidazole-succinocarboxamide synthase
LLPLFLLKILGLMQEKAIKNTQFQFSGLKDIYHGKVRDVYFFKDKLAVVATDRISAFDHILPEAIPYKGQVLNQIAAYFLEATKSIVPNWVEEVPHANVTIGKNCQPIRLEMVIRGYLTGHAWRTYKNGERELCGNFMPEGMKENQQFETPIITPAAKAAEGHDIDISKEEIIKQGIVSETVWNTLEDYTRKLFKKGTEMAAEKGLILVDTKYEFGFYNGEVILIDENTYTRFFALFLC